MGRIVVVAYKPKSGRNQEVRALCAKHVPLLRAEGLATGRPAITAEAADGAVIEVFEWESPEAIEKAHKNVPVQRLWEQFGEVCGYVPIGSLAEASQLFSEFAPIE